jgi:DNA-directed RNA polymerase subunit H (RpoH/RPB5)
MHKLSNTTVTPNDNVQVELSELSTDTELIVDPRGPAFIIYILLSLDSQCIGSTVDFKKLIDGLPYEYKTQNTDVVIVSYNVLSSQIKKYIKTMTDGKIYPRFSIECYQYVTFKAESHVLVLTHSILTESQLIQLEEKYKFSRVNLPKIFYTEPQIAWIGARPGHVIRYEIPTYTTGLVANYRYCIREDD